MSSVEALALRCILPGFIGTEAPDWVRRRAASGLGGLVLFARNVESPEQLTMLTASLHSERPGLLIAIDEEGGDVTRLEARTGSSYPGNLALGEAADPCLTADVASAIGLELNRVGIDLDLAPVADVNSNPLNPVIGVRSFGSDAEAVAGQTAAWVAGLQRTGVAACAKHFPGHGDTAVDSHLALPIAGEDPRLHAIEPFKAAIAAGVRAIMSAHIVAPAIDDLPATISSKVMMGLLRDELGFQGVAMSDALEMRGLSRGRGVAESAVLALIAGCDALCIGGRLAGEDVVEQVLAAIAGAVRTGRLAEKRLAQAAGRVDSLAAWRAGQHEVGVSPDGVGLTAARKAVRFDGPVRVSDTAVVVRFPAALSIAAGDVPWGVAESLSARGVHVEAREAGSVDAAAVPPDTSLVLVVRDLHRQQENVAHIEELLTRRPDAVVVEMGLPAYRPRGAKAYIATYGSARVCAAAAAEVLRP
ncbi:MAG: glycoside hydrolase family 3 protein [Chloroflexi bacterium]|nr:MAG: glycoside hydrolase family 3 protein [Chloroflexota bacterium]